MRLYRNPSGLAACNPEFRRRRKYFLLRARGIPRPFSARNGDDRLMTDSSGSKVGLDIYDGNDKQKNFSRRLCSQTHTHRAYPAGRNRPAKKPKKSKNTS